MANIFLKQTSIFDLINVLLELSQYKERVRKKKHFWVWMYIYNKKKLGLEDALNHL